MNLSHSTIVGLGERFWSKVDVRGEDECWPWTAYLNKGGYGVYGSVSRRTDLAHRLALAERLGRPLEEGECALHTCDNPPCCNPAHLWAGTLQENTADRVKKGRNGSAPGSRHGQSKLTEGQVKAIRIAYENGKPQSELADLYEVSPGLIGHIVRRAAWRHVK